MTRLAATFIFLAAAYGAGMVSAPKLEPRIVEKPVVTVRYLPVPASIINRAEGIRPKYRKLYHDRISIEPVAVAGATDPLPFRPRQTVVKVASAEAVAVPKAKPQIKRLPCKAGRWRNSQGQCGRWGTQ